MGMGGNGNVNVYTKKIMGMGTKRLADMIMGMGLKLVGMGRNEKAESHSCTPLN